MGGVIPLSLALLITLYCKFSSAEKRNSPNTNTYKERRPSQTDHSLLALGRGGIIIHNWLCCVNLNDNELLVPMHLSSLLF